MLQKRLMLVVGVLIAFSMVLSACGPTTTATTVPQQPQPTQPPQATAVPQPTAVPAPAGGPPETVVFTAIPDAAAGVAQLQAGAIDMYPVTADDAEVFKTVKADKNLSYASVFGSNDQMLLNTTACTDKTLLNPFTDMKIREAMNYMIDRNYIVQEIFGGLAVPRFTAIDYASPDAARFAGELGAIATQYAYNLDKAKAVVDAEMPTMGATQGADGKWQFNGKPVTIIGLIRTEDKRKEIGEYFANQLEKLGFTVDRQEKVRKEASPIWAQSDPAECKFNFYTAGWINSAIQRDEGLNFAQFNEGNIQQIPTFLAFKPSAELKAADDALYTNSFKTMDERAQFFKTALKDSMTESWWGVWVVDVTAFEPYSSKVAAASDLMAGLSNKLLPYTLVSTAQQGGTIHIAQSGIMVDPYNPVNGSNWTDDHTIYNMTADWGVVPDPYTGLYLPKMVVKGDVVAKTGLPITKTLDWVSLSFQDSIAVPDDAWADWDAAKQVFITAKDRAAADPKYQQTANVQVTVTFSPDLYKTKWHDGSNFSMADVIMGMILNWDPGKKESKIYDEGFAPSVDLFMSHFKGVKIVSTDPLVITTWDDQYALDAENTIGQFTTMDWYPSDVYLYGTGAWHNLTPAILAEADGKIAMSADKAQKLKVDRTGMVTGPTLAVMSQYLDTVAASGAVPYAPTLGKYVTADEAKARYANLEAFYKAHGHLWIGTGPYFIDKVDSTAGSITETRFKDYLFPSDQFAGFGEARVAAAAIDGPAQVKAGDDAPFTVAVTFKDQPYPSKDLDKVSYTVFAADGSVAASGEAKLGAEGSYAIDLAPDVTSKLPAGATTLSVAVASKVVALPTFATYQFVVTP